MEYWLLQFLILLNIYIYNKKNKIIKIIINVESFYDIVEDLRLVQKFLVSLLPHNFVHGVAKSHAVRNYSAFR